MKREEEREREYETDEINETNEKFSMGQCTSKIKSYKRRNN